MTDAPKPPTEEEMASWVREWEEVVALGQGPGFDADARCGLRLIAEVRRLRQLVIDAEPYVPDNEQTRTMDLPARLKAEVDR